jgi:hypothetical protein
VESGLIPVGAQVLLSTHLDRENSVADGRLRRNEGVVLVVERKPELQSAMPDYALDGA